MFKTLEFRCWPWALIYLKVLIYYLKTLTFKRINTIHLITLTIHSNLPKFLMVSWMFRTHPYICSLQSVTALSFLWGSPGFLPWVQVPSSWQGPHWWQRPPCKLPTAHQEQFGVQYLAQLDMQLSQRSLDFNQQPKESLKCSSKGQI